MNKLVQTLALIYLISLTCCGNRNNIKMENQINMNGNKDATLAIEIIAPFDTIKLSDIVFFFAGVSRWEEDYQGNFRYIITKDQVLYYAQNSDLNNDLFNEKLQEIVVLNENDINEIKSFLNTYKFYDLEKTVKTPDSLDIEGGNNYYIYACFNDEASCVKFEPGNNIEDQIEKVLNSIVNSKD
jgi:hypothetical protein